MMQDTLAALFEGYNLSHEEVKKYTAEILSVSMLHIIGASESKLSEDDKIKVQDLLTQQKALEALDLVHSKYENGEWDNLLEQQMKPVIQSYFKEILSK